MKYHLEIIECPECGYIQQAKIEHTKFWHIYAHECRYCGYWITESEWQKKYEKQYDKNLAYH